MSEDTGFPAPAEPPLPAFTPEPETPEEPIAAEDVPAEPEPAEAVTEPPAEAAPFVPDTGVADWLREAFASIHRRLSNLGG